MTHSTPATVTVNYLGRVNFTMSTDEAQSLIDAILNFVPANERPDVVSLAKQFDVQMESLFEEAA